MIGIDPGMFDLFREEVRVHADTLARDLLVELRRHDRDLDELATRIRTAVDASGTTVTDVHGIGPIMAAYILGHTRDIARFKDAGHYARYNGTAPISASTSARNEHRLNRDGNRQLNHAIHIAAVTQVAHDTLKRPGSCDCSGYWVTASGAG